MNAPRRVVIAGASGFVGQALIRAMSTENSIIALSRRARRAEPGVEYRACDLFSLIDAEKGVEGAEAAVYLVHSMMPSARLTQGSFRDFDLIAADNFARACAKSGIRQIVYLSGLIPEGQKLSEHLASRLEVEKALGAHGAQVTVLRAGLVLGGGGSSFLILRRLVERLPAMALPAWTRTRMQPIALEDAVALIRFCLFNPATYGQIYDIGADEVLTYEDLIARTAKALNVKRPSVAVPLLSPGLSGAWVELITGAPSELVEPLIESLKSPMVCRDRRLQEMARLRPLSVEEALYRAVRESSGKPVAFQKSRTQEVNDVRSVQRLPLPEGASAADVAQEYLRTLPELMFWMIRVDSGPDGIASFYLRATNTLLLRLKLSQERSTPDRQLFYITGGMLALNVGRGRLEFRSFPELHVLLSAIHEFRPRLPWPIYTNSQALAHLWVTQSFGEWLTRHGISKSSASAARE